MRELANCAPWDRVLRVALGGGLLFLGWCGVVTGILGVACQLFGWFPLVTGIAGWCPFYVLLGHQTRRDRAHHGSSGRH